MNKDRQNLMSLALLFHCLLLNMFRMLVHPSSGACELLWIYFMCCIALVRCVVGVTVWFGWGGVVSLCRLKQTNLMSLALFHHLLLNMFRMLVQPSSGASDLLWIYLMCYIAL